MNRAFTLVEILMAMCIIGVLLASTASVTLLAGRAMPTTQELTSGTQAARDCTARVLDDLQLAQAVYDVTERSFKATLADQTGDGEAERVSWSFESATGLERTFNDSSETLPDVRDFTLKLFAREHEPQPGAPTFQQPRILARCEFLGGTSLFVQPGWVYTQYVPPVLTTDVWKPTDIELYLQTFYPETGTIRIRVYSATPANGRGPLLHESTILESNLRSAGGWVNVPLSINTPLSHDEALAIEVATEDISGISCQMHYDYSYIPQARSSLLVSTPHIHYHTGWTLVYRLRGSTFGTPEPDPDNPRPLVATRAQVGVTLSGGAALEARALAAKPSTVEGSAVVVENP